jgi:hypothetical protein
VRSTHLLASAFHARNISSTYTELVPVRKDSAVRLDCAVGAVERTARAALLSAALHVVTLDDLRRFQSATGAGWPLRGARDIGGDDGYHEVLVAVLNPDLRFVVEAEVNEKTVDPLFEKLKDYFLAQGVEKGIERGIERGIEKGRVEGALSAARDILLGLVATRGWRLGPAERRRVEACQDPRTLSTWATRVATAHSLDEALAG